MKTKNVVSILMQLVVAGAAWASVGSAAPELLTPRANVVTLVTDFRFTVNNEREVYRADAQGIYHLEEYYAEERFESALNGVADPAEEKVDTDLPDKEKGEYARYRLSQNGDQLYLQMEMAIETRPGTLLRKTQDFKLEFVKGDLADFDRGAPVTLRYSDEAMRAMETFTRDMVAELSRESMLYGLSSEGISPENVRCEVNVVKLANSTIEISGETIRETSVGEEIVTSRVVFTVTVPQ